MSVKFISVHAKQLAEMIRNQIQTTGNPVQLTVYEQTANITGELLEDPEIFDVTNVVATGEPRGSVLVTLNGGPTFKNPVWIVQTETKTPIGEMKIATATYTP